MRHHAFCIIPALDDDTDSQYSRKTLTQNFQSELPKCLECPRNHGESVRVLLPCPPPVLSFPAGGADGRFGEDRGARALAFIYIYTVLDLDLDLVPLEVISCSPLRSLARIPSPIPSFDQCSVVFKK
jgi:hypothetical protein